MENFEDVQRKKLSRMAHRNLQTGGYATDEEIVKEENDLDRQKEARNRNEYITRTRLSLMHILESEKSTEERVQQIAVAVEGLPEGEREDVLKWLLKLESALHELEVNKYLQRLKKKSDEKKEKGEE